MTDFSNKLISLYKQYINNDDVYYENIKEEIPNQDERNKYIVECLFDARSHEARKLIRKILFELSHEDWEFISALRERKNDDIILLQKELYKQTQLKKVWLDDERPAPSGWYHVKTATEAIELINSCTVEEISLDNDLGLEDQEGYDVLKYIEETVFHNPSFKAPIIHIHTANPVARQKMKAGLENIKRMKIK